MVGEELGSYRVLEPIGKGGMAAVFVGQHVVLGHRVAIKILHHAHPENPMVERRFINEAKAIAAIRNPGIVEVFDFGRGPDGRAYIVMELLDGETLRARMRRVGAMGTDESLIFARQIADALAAAHDVGIVHRDLKPDNIFLVPDTEVEMAERAKVLDFGVAKQLSDYKPASEATATGVLVGTPAYMSPEQCRGTGEIDHRSDVYSLGIVLFRMVTGQLPFESAGTGELIGKHIYEPPPRVASLTPGVPARLADIIDRCLAKDPAQRFQTMRELSEALRSVREEISGRSPSSAPEFPVPLIDPGVMARGKPPVREDEEPTHPTTMRAATGEAYRVPPAKAPWTLPVALGGALALGVFLALLMSRSGPDEPGGVGEAVHGAAAPVADPNETRPWAPGSSDAGAQAVGALARDAGPGALPKDAGAATALADADAGAGLAVDEDDIVLVEDDTRGAVSSSRRGDGRSKSNRDRRRRAGRTSGSRRVRSGTEENRDKVKDPKRIPVPILQ